VFHFVILLFSGLTVRLLVFSRMARIETKENLKKSNAFLSCADPGQSRKAAAVFHIGSKKLLDRFEI
jgi:hypothetical protein